MEILAGFLIATVIALTGVGAGVITAPVLILFLGVPPSTAVGTALAYAAVVKIVVAAAQIMRRNVNYKVLAYMLAGGIPGVVIGALLFRSAAKHQQWAILYWVLGAIIIFSSGWNLYRHFWPGSTNRPQKERPKLISGLMLPIGAEVGFSSSGAGALGTVTLLSLTSMPAAKVVGTDIVFGLVVALIGSGIHILGGSYNMLVLIKLICGGIGGALTGSWIAPYIPNRPLRAALAVWLIFIGVEICIKAAHP